MPCFTLFKGIIDCRHGLVQGGLLMPVLWLALAAQNLRTGQAEGGGGGGRMQAGGGGGGGGGGGVWGGGGGGGGGGGLGCSQNTVPVDFHLKARL